MFSYVIVPTKTSKKRSGTRLFLPLAQFEAQLYMSSQLQPLTEKSLLFIRLPYQPPPHPTSYLQAAEH